jgi:LAO/AO transport system kinase
VAVCSIPPVEGVRELIEALDEHRGRVDLAARRSRARRTGALLAFAAEHGERGLRALGGRRAAERLLQAQDPALDSHALSEALERASEARKEPPAPGKKPATPGKQLATQSDENLGKGER